MRPGGFYPGSWYGGGFQTPFMFYGARRRFFPRILWFALGAGTYAFWSQHKEKERAFLSGNYPTGNHNKEWASWSGSRWGCHRHRELQQQQQQQQQQAWAAAHHQQQQPVFVSPVAPATVATSAPASAPVETAPPTPAPTPAQFPAPVQDSTEWPAERMREVRKQAGDTMAEMSEHAIDSILANLQSLKAKIAEARESRERMEKEGLVREQRVPSDKKDYPDRLV